MALWECFEYGLEQLWIFRFFLSIECGPGMSRYFLVFEYSLKQVWIVRYLIFSSICKLFESTEMTLVPVASVQQSRPIIALCHSQILELGSISSRYVVDKEFSQLNSPTWCWALAKMEGRPVRRNVYLFAKKFSYIFGDGTIFHCWCLPVRVLNWLLVDLLWLLLLVLSQFQTWTTTQNFLLLSSGPTIVSSSHIVAI